MLRLPEARIRCVALDVGGGFGVKGHVYPEDLLIPFLARRLGRPVKWIEDRREHLICSCHSRDQIHDVEVGFDDEGRILALRDSFIVDCGAWNPIGAGVVYNTAVASAGSLQDRRHGFRGPDRRHQQSAERAVSRRRPAGSRLRHGAHRRSRRRRAWPRASRGAAAQHDPRRRNALCDGHAVSRRPAHRLRRRRLSVGAGKGAGGDRRASMRFACGSARRASEGRYLGLGSWLLCRGHRRRPVRERAVAHRAVRQDFRRLRRLPARAGHGDDLRADRRRCLECEAGRCGHYARRYRRRSLSVSARWRAAPPSRCRRRSTVRRRSCGQKCSCIAANMLECSATDLELRNGHVGIVGVPGAECHSARSRRRRARAGTAGGRPASMPGSRRRSISSRRR